ncbi:hypothetical protein ACHAXA_000778 [Cyclostephanos tholiformis]|uniref:Uncharacterized protein n=1 Tax=Cyclostephanos tholiformis TaxID=382380 RepID=A0ABD3REB0_9STRA
MRKLNARETYMAHRKYFDGIPSDDGGTDNLSVARDVNDRCGRVFDGSSGEDGCIDDIPFAHDVSDTSSMRVFITKKALVLARSLKLDVYDIFLDMKEHALVSDVAVEMAKVTENDVRDYLDRRCDRLISIISMNDYERIETHMIRNPRFNGEKNIDYERQNSAYFGLRRAKEVYHRNWRESEDIDNSRKARFRPYPSMLQPKQKEFRSGNQYFRRGIHDKENRIGRQADILRRETPLTARRPVYEAKSSTHYIGSVPLSQLVSKPWSEPQTSLESYDVSQFRQTSRQIFRNTYRVEQEQQRQRHEEQLKSADVLPRNQMPECDEFF